MVKKILITIFISQLFFALGIPLQAQTDNSFSIVKKYFKNLNNNNWGVIPELWVKDQRENLVNFISDKKNQNNQIGLFNIKEAMLVIWKEIPYNYAEIYLPDRYMDKFSNKKVYYVGVDYKVHTENKYHINGINYFFVVVAFEGDEWKIVLTPLVPITSIISDGYGFGTDDERNFDKRRLQFSK